MSFTTVSETETQRTTRRILLTPPKRQRQGRVSNKNETRKAPETREEGSSIEEIWKWTLRPDAVATCFARDVFDMRDNLVGGEEIFWADRLMC
jgi:hypothetical protein